MEIIPPISHVMHTLLTTTTAVDGYTEIRVGVTGLRSWRRSLPGCGQHNR